MTKDEAFSLLVSAVEQGAVAYWARVSEYDPEKGACFHEYDDITGEEISKKYISLEDIQNAKLTKDNVAEWVWKDFVTGEHDSVTADCIIQIIMFCEIKYS